MEPHATILGRFIASLLFIVFSTLPPLVNCHTLPVVAGDQHDSAIRTYIVHVKKPKGAELLGGEKLEEHLRRWHLSFLPNVTLDSGEPRLVYSYSYAISGFAARLSGEEVAAMDGMEGFLYALPDKNHSLATTYTPDFLGLRQPQSGAWSRSSRGEGVIIAVLDGGIFPQHLSFAYGTDDGMPDPPAKWNGTCELKVCNKKLIGAISFVKSNLIPEDMDGHGTHVAGIAAGVTVEDAELYGMAKGTASGTAPGAHLAVYMVCDYDDCSDVEVLAAINQAIKDGVDVINLSLGAGMEIDNFHADNIAIGSLSAVKEGIVVVAAAGNDGPDPETLGNSAPWLVVVGATSTDRRIRATVTLDSGEEILGEAVYVPDASTKSTTTPVLPIVYPGVNGDDDAKYCKSLSASDDVMGNIVLCWLPHKGDPLDISLAVEKAGGAGTIIMNGEKHSYTTQVAYTTIPASFLSFADGRRIVSYFRTSQSSGSAPTASIALDGTRFGHRPSPGLASFSSRGPAAPTGGILKPDVLAPGVNVLSTSHFGWDDESDSTPGARRFWFKSGTSMAAPHVAGIAALIKGQHPQWSPAAIQSAIITSASNLDLDGNIIVDENPNLAAGIFDTGAGQVNASGAIDPGLVYDFHPNDYTGYLCGLGYTDKNVEAVLAGEPVKCSKISKTSAGQLNYPSIAWVVDPASRTITVTRTVTNVGESSSVYVAKITEPEGVRVQVSPHELRFQWLQQTATFSVTLTVKSSHIRVGGSSSGGKLQWVSDKHVVTSPIAVLFKKAQPPTPSTTDVL